MAPNDPESSAGPCQFGKSVWFGISVRDSARERAGVVQRRADPPEIMGTLQPYFPADVLQPVGFKTFENARIALDNAVMLLNNDHPLPTDTIKMFEKESAKSYGEAQVRPLAILSSERLSLELQALTTYGLLVCERLSLWRTLVAEASVNVTILLNKLREGDQNVLNQLVPLVYAELRRMAGAYMKHEGAGHVLQPTALVNEAYLRLAGSPNNWQNRAHFFAIAASTMRQILLDYARRKHAGRRGGADAQSVNFDDNMLVEANTLQTVIEVDELLRRLEQIDQRQARVVELRFFGGLNDEETAEVMGISESIAKFEWKTAKAWLAREMQS